MYQYRYWIVVGIVLTTIFYLTSWKLDSPFVFILGMVGTLATLLGIGDYIEKYVDKG